jgi:hypothetical protein
MAFHEDWYSAEQLFLLRETVRFALGLDGLFIEIGSWEGRSTVAIAQECFPQQLHAIDTWMGNEAEQQRSGRSHPSVIAAQQRDVLADFLENVHQLTRGNVTVHQSTDLAYLEILAEPVAFCHLDASHDYLSVKLALEKILPHLVPGGILCGDDFQNAHAGRQDLQGGVERAVREILPGFQGLGNFWRYQKREWSGSNI